MPGVVQIASGIGITMGHEDRLCICGFLPAGVIAGLGMGCFLDFSCEY